MTLGNINRAAVDRIIRVDHAGEYGANRIYAGQMAVLGRTSVGPVIQVGAALSLSAWSTEWGLARWGPKDFQVINCVRSCILRGFTLCPPHKWKLDIGEGGVKAYSFCVWSTEGHLVHEQIYGISIVLTFRVRVGDHENGVENHCCR